MILSCPECATRYLVDPVALGADGRMVRCGKCGHTWAQQPPPDMPRAIDPPPLRADISDEGGFPSGPAGLPAIRRARRESSARVAWLALMVLLVAIVAGGLLLRDEVIARFPAAMQLYAALGLASEPAGAGLKLSVVRWRQVDAEGGKTLLIEGEINNPTPRIKAVPKLRALLFDSRDREVQRWSFSAPETRLMPGETAAFRTEIRNPSGSAVGLTVVFEEAG